jgi:hypothetical protein
MKALLTLIFIAASLTGQAQKHQIALSGGINNINSWDAEEPHFGLGSPYDSQLGYSVSLSYAYIFKNNISLSLRNSLTFLNFQADDWDVFRNENNEVVSADVKLFNQYYHASLGGGYLFQINDRYSINAEAGASVLFYYKQISYSVGYPETHTERKLEWEEGYRSYGIFLAIDHNYRIYKSRKYSLHLTGSLRATHIFNYLPYINDFSRVLPELNIGIVIAFGNQQRNRF